MRLWPNWRNPLIILQTETLIGWHLAVFRISWRWKSRLRFGRPGKDQELIQLIRVMWRGSPRIRDELAKAGLMASTATLRKYRPKLRGKPP